MLTSKNFKKAKIILYSNFFQKFGEILKNIIIIFRQKQLFEIQMYKSTKSLKFMYEYTYTYTYTCTYTGTYMSIL